MAYVAASAFRPATLAEYCRGLKLDTSKVGDAELTSAIARMSERVDDYTGDHFEPETLTLELAGRGGRYLYLPSRVRSVTSVKRRASDGTLTTEDSTTYRVVSSLDSAGTDVLSLAAKDYIYLISTTWPVGPQTVQVVGSFGWASPPDDIRRAAALLVWDHFKEESDTLRRAASWDTPQARFERSTGPSGLPEVDSILQRYTRKRPTVGSIPIVRAYEDEVIS